MTGKDEARAYFASIAVAYTAKAGYLDQAGVERLSARVAGLVSPDHDLRSIVADFADAFADVRHDAAAVALAGERLLRRVLILARPVPPGADRLDLNG